jgi:hypothetical protein
VRTHSPASQKGTVIVTELEYKVLARFLLFESQMWNGPYSSLTVQPRLFVNTRQKPCGVSPHFSLLTHSVAYFRDVWCMCRPFPLPNGQSTSQPQQSKELGAPRKLRWNPNENPSTTFSLLPLYLLAMALPFGHPP